MRRPISLLALFAFLPAPLLAATIDRATLTEVVNNVKVIDPATRKPSSVKVQDIFHAPNILRTGSNSRAELVAEDETVTRVGQNTLFSFQADSREINLEKGSLLFQSPTGKGGGTIRTASASAAVLGTTLIVSTTKNGGFKVLLVEGKGRVKGPDGTVRNLKDGQMVYALPGGKLSPVFMFQLSQQVGASKLISGFKKPVPSINKIRNAISRQEKLIRSGELRESNLLAGDSPDYAIQVDVAADTLIKEKFGEPALSPFQVALGTDAIIAAPELDPLFLFSLDDPAFSDLASATGSMSEDFSIDSFSGSATTLFAARNISFETPTVDLSPFADRDLFLFLALNDIDFAGSVDFTGLSSDLELVALNNFTAAPGVKLSAHTDNFTLRSFGAGSSLDSAENTASSSGLKLTDLSIQNYGGNVNLHVPHGSFSGLRIDTADNIVVESARDLAIDSPKDFVPVQRPEGGHFADAPSGVNSFVAPNEVSVRAARDLTISRAVFTADKTSLIAGRRVKLSQVQLNQRLPQQDPDFGTANPRVHVRGGFGAGGLIDMRNSTVNATDVLMEAFTVTLRHVDFPNGGLTVLKSNSGQVTINQPTEMGKVNLINVTHGGQNVTSQVDVDTGSGTPSGSGIFIRKTK